jgi:hypothetical protein
MASNQFTPEMLAVMFGILLSLVLSYFPIIKTKWAAFDGDVKRVIMLVAFAVITLAVFGLSCTTLKDSFGLLASVSCTQAGAIELFKIFIAAVIANQTTFMLSPNISGNSEKQLTTDELVKQAAQDEEAKYQWLNKIGPNKQ